MTTTPPTHHSTDPAAVEKACRAHGLEPVEFHELRRRSEAAKATAYCPYSNFRVGAVLLAGGGGKPNDDDDDAVYVAGSNVENAAYPVGVCAERVALSKAVTADDAGGGLHRRGIRALAVCTDVAPPASPCGMCRQFIREFCDLKMPVFMFDKNADFVVLRLEELLPLSFGPEHLQSSRLPS